MHVFRSNMHLVSYTCTFFSLILFSVFLFSRYLSARSLKYLVLFFNIFLLNYIFPKDTLKLCYWSEVSLEYMQLHEKRNIYLFWTLIPFKACSFCSNELSPTTLSKIFWKNSKKCLKCAYMMGNSQF